MTDLVTRLTEAEAGGVSAYYPHRSTTQAHVRQNTCRWSCHSTVSVPSSLSTSAISRSANLAGAEVFMILPVLAVPWGARRANSVSPPNQTVPSCTRSQFSAWSGGHQRYVRQASVPQPSCPMSSRIPCRSHDPAKLTYSKALDGCVGHGVAWAKVASGTAAASIESSATSTPRTDRRTPIPPRAHSVAGGEPA